MKPFLIFCALCCFAGIFKLPIEYYSYLRILVSIGALLVLYSTITFRQHYFSIVFLVVLILFNPVFPIYLYRKNIWIPIDILTGILFLLIGFVEKQQEKKEESAEENPEPSATLPIHQRTVSRDRIINPKKTKEE
ncbi:DUF6804 family protein [Chryseobacterium sp. JK1]|uniref:DUF6804 family protein n=1 Tax=Chryseobacterium sp. JK1 TaxID=874294 RepID=UPI003D68D4A6